MYKELLFTNRLTSILFLSLLILSCSAHKNKKKILDFGIFSIEVPNEWNAFKQKGIDSYVGGITNKTDTLWFDYGWYSYEIGDEQNDSMHLFAQDTINGFQAIIQIPKVEGNGSIGMSIEKIDKQNRFYIGGQNLKNTEAILSIVKTIKFFNGDTTKNKQINRSKFTSRKFKTGKQIFETNCISCHITMKDATGPALNADLIKNRSDEWLLRFFTDKKSILTDTCYLKNKRRFGNVDCILLKQLSKQEINKLITFIRNKSL